MASIVSLRLSKPFLFVKKSAITGDNTLFISGIVFPILQMWNLGVYLCKEEEEGGEKAIRYKLTAKSLWASAWLLIRSQLVSDWFPPDWVIRFQLVGNWILPELLKSLRYKGRGVEGILGRASLLKAHKGFCWESCLSKVSIFIANCDRIILQIAHKESIVLLFNPTFWQCNSCLSLGFKFDHFVVGGV